MTKMTAKGGLASKTGMIRIIRVITMAGTTEMTLMPGMTQMTRMARMTRMKWITKMAGVDWDHWVDNKGDYD